MPNILTDAEVEALDMEMSVIHCERPLIRWGRHWQTRAREAEGELRIVLARQDAYQIQAEQAWRERDEARGIAIRTSENLASTIADRLAAEVDRDSWRRLARDDSPYCEVHQ